MMKTEPTLIHKIGTTFVVMFILWMFTIITLKLFRNDHHAEALPMAAASEHDDDHHRSTEWPKVRAKHLESHNECAACGYSGPGLQVHHVVPFHNDPSKELDPKNLITLCGSQHWNCHFRFGHLGNFKCENPQIVKDAQYFRNRLNSRECK